MESTIFKIMYAIPFHTTDWSKTPATIHPGESGTATWQTINYDGLRIRKITYSPKYKADHWCSLGHIVYCLEGEFYSELADGRSFHLSAGMSYLVSDGVSSHRSTTEKGTTLLIIDGKFLGVRNEMESNPWRM
jgi:hypothetical protein